MAQQTNWPRNCKASNGGRSPLPSGSAGFATAAGIGLSMSAMNCWLPPAPIHPKRGGADGYRRGLDDELATLGTWNNQFTAPFGQAFFGACLTEN